MDSYDPANPPPPRAWLALSEMERIDLAEEHHRDVGGFGENLRLHATVHVIVENQVAMEDPPEAARALRRLLAEGLDRHDAVHAVGSVLANSLFPVLKATDGSVPFDATAYARSLDGLSAESWRANG